MPDVKQLATTVLTAAAFDDDDDIGINVPLLAGLLSGLGTLFLGMICAAIWFALTSSGAIRLGSGEAGSFDDAQSFLEAEQNALESMDSHEREQYLLAKEFQEEHPPNSVNTDISLSQFMTIQEKGVSAWEFEPDNNNCFVEARTEIQFMAGPCTVQTNLPVPKQNDVYYWEAKVYEKPESTNVSVGLSTKPYPTFRMPGYHRYSVAYDTEGLRRLNQPFSAPHYGPKLQQGDVVGVGYRPRTGTIFFTRNGKKLEDALHGMRMNLFPSVGADGPCTVLVNFGRAGFVYIEANVKKWGLAPAQGSLAPPPPYGAEHDFVLLETGQGNDHASSTSNADNQPSGNNDNLVLNAHDNHIASSSVRPAHLQPPPPFADEQQDLDNSGLGSDSIGLTNLQAGSSSLTGSEQQQSTGRASPPPSYVSQESDADEEEDGVDDETNDESNRLDDRSDDRPNDSLNEDSNDQSNDGSTGGSNNNPKDSQDT